MAVLVAIVAFGFTLGPSNLARNLDRVGTGMQHEGYRLIPLCMEYAAMNLDPAEPRYVMHTAELYDTLGKPEAARALRDDLKARWESYADMLLRQEIDTDAILHPEPIAAGETVQAR